MSSRIRSVILMSAVLFPAAIARSSDQAVEPFKFFREYVGLNDRQIATIQSGKALARVLESRTVSAYRETMRSRSVTQSIATQTSDGSAAQMN